MFDWVKRGVSAVRTTVETGAKAIDRAIDLPKPPNLPGPGDVIDFGKSVFETAKGAATKAVTDPKDFVRDAARETLRLGWEGADRFLPSGTVPFALKAAEAGVDAGTKPLVAVFGKDSAVGKLADDLSRVDLEGITRTDGLKADWGKLWGTWLFEQKPADLGTWDKVTVDGQPMDRVTITRPDYTGDLASRPHQQRALEQFLKEHPDPKRGDTLSQPLLYSFTGEGTAEGGDYTALEWFTGSYRTQITCVGNDPETGKPLLQFEVTNESHWESGTRVPATGQNAGLGDYLVPDSQRDHGAGLGGDFLQRYVWTQPAP